MRVVAICSGGLDSTTMYYRLKSKHRDVLPINFSYGSRHNPAERSRAKKLIPGLLEIDIDLSFLSSSSLMKSGPAVPHGHYEEENMRSTVVPFRNGIMLAYAIAKAEEMHYDAVALGSHAGDHAIYPDCRVEFTEAMDKASCLGTYYNIHVMSPFNTYSKTDIVKIAKELGMLDIIWETWSCYEGDTGDGLHCGLCGACNERKEAFREAGVLDKTAYRS